MIVLKYMAVGRRMSMSATSAAIIASALSQPNSRSEGRLENTVIASPQANTGRCQDQWRPDQDRRPFHAHRRIRIDVLDLQPIEKMDGGAQAKPE